MDVSFLARPTIALDAPRVLLALCAVVAAPLAAQSVNVDVGVHPTYGVPSSSFGAAAGQTGAWNAVPVTIGSPTPVVDVMGAASSVTVTFSGGVATAQNTNLGGASADELALLGDVLDPGSVQRTVTIAGLVAGDYDVYTYAIAPDDPTFTTLIGVVGSTDPVQTIGGPWPSGFVLGTTHAIHRVTVAPSADVVITVQRTPPPPMGVNFGSLNGIQLVRLPTSGTSFCAGDNVDPNVSTDCPCANFGTSGRGCANSSNPAGALLNATGLPANDDVVLHGSAMPSTSACIYLQGDAVEDIAFGDGVRCAGGMLIRLRTKANAAGASSFPDTTDLFTLSQRGGVVPGSGATRYYQTYYRNASVAFCPTATFNVTNGWTITW